MSLKADGTTSNFVIESIWIDSSAFNITFLNSLMMMAIDVISENV